MVLLVIIYFYRNINVFVCIYYMESNHLNEILEYTSIPLSHKTNSGDNGLDSNSSSASNDNTDTPVKINIMNNDEVIIDMTHVQEEDNLVHYTDNHFMSLTYKDLERIRNTNTPSLTFTEDRFIQYNASSNSPVLSVLDSNRGSRSNSNSNSNSDDENDFVEIVGNDNHSHIETDQTNLAVLHNDNVMINRKQHRRHYNKLNYQDVEQSIRKYYTQNSNALCSGEIDILTTFIKGQKNLYIQSKLITQQKLNCLVIPAILISAFITIISPFVECKSWNVGIISGLNAIVTLFISLMNLLKFESSVEKFSLLASLFDNIETSLDLTSSKLRIIQQDSETASFVLSKFNEVETKICDYKLTNAVLIPEEIKVLFPIISHINIFSFIKKTELYKKNLIEKLRDIKNEIYYILYRWDKEDRILRRQLQLTNIPPVQSARHNKLHEQERIGYLYKLKDNIKQEIIEFQYTYSIMETIFTREISFAGQKRNKWWFCLLCHYWKPPTLSYDYLDGITPVMYPYFKDIISEYTRHH